MYKVLIWGIGNDYDGYLNYIKFEELKNNIVVEALVCKSQDRYSQIRDGYKVVVAEDVPKLEFDYIIVTSSLYYREIEKKIQELGVDVNKIIDVTVFTIPYFDFAKYVSLIENPVSIFCENCWGGVVYKRLKLPFSSPFINIDWPPQDFAKLLLKPDFYLKQEFKMEREGNLKDGVFPIASLGTGEDKVKMNLIHNETFEKAKEQWDRRKKRINNENIFVKFGFNSIIDDDIKKYCINSYEQVKYKKILVYYGDESELTFKSERFIWEQTKNGTVELFNYNWWFLNSWIKEVNIFNLLTTGKGYSRNDTNEGI